MDKMKFLKIIIGVLLLINLVTLGFVFGPMVSGPKGGIQKHFGFDKEQMVAFEKSRVEIRSKLDQLNPKLREMSKAYYSLEEEGESGAAMLDQIGEINTDIYKAHLKHFQDLREISTPKQREMVPGFIDRLMNNGTQKGPKSRQGPMGRGPKGPPERGE